MMYISRAPVLFLAALILGAAARELRAQSVAYHTHGTGSYSPIDGDYGGVGMGTHLGRHAFSGKVATSPTANPLVFDVWPTAPHGRLANEPSRDPGTGWSPPFTERA